MNTRFLRLLPLVLAITSSVISAPAGTVLYLANLHPAPGVTGSIGSGTGTIIYDPSSNTGTVNIAFSNLSSAEVVAHLELGVPGQNATYVLNLPQGQVIAQNWTFAASGQYSSNDILNALKTGNIFVEIDSATHPAGELTGQFIQSAGSQTFTPPGDPPALSSTALTNPSQTDAVRFLTQATFGPTVADIAAVTNQGINAWITAQMAMPASLHLPATRADAAAFVNPQPTSPGANYYKVQQANRQAAWWNIAVKGNDQLRQRVAFALSEILVISDSNSKLAQEAEAMAKYYDLLVTSAFGNYRQLLNDVTLTSVMGVWLSSLQNQLGNVAAGTSPDENYAREVQQLFSIGLVQLQPDGTLKLDQNGLPIPTYNQTTIVETAKVFTGWAFSNPGNNFFSYPPSTYANGAADDNGWLNPMQYYDKYHDKTSKTIVDGVVIPAGQDGPTDLKKTLDTLFNHPNTGPFIAQHLIQSLVTSNPSPDYVYRVAKVFADNGSGVRGDLGAVVRAILTDYEARSPNVLSNTGYGKLREPLLRITSLFRVFKASAGNGRLLGSNNNKGTILTNPEVYIEQAAMRSPTVFNFFSPDYVLPGPVAAAGLVAPEFEITDATSAINTPNVLYSYTYATAQQTQSPDPTVVLDFSSLVPLAVQSDPSSLLAQLNLLFCCNSMSSTTSARITTLLKALPVTTTQLDLVRTAVELTLFSPDSAVQR